MKRLQVLLLPVPELFEPWCSDVIEAIGERHDQSVYDPTQPLVAQFSNIDVVIDHGGSVSTAAMMAAATHVRLWQVLGTGFDHFDLETMRARGVPVTHCPGQFSATALAETAMMFLLMLASGYKQRTAGFAQRVSYQPIGDELGGAHLLIIGFGASGQELARPARAFGMEISAIDVRPMELDAAVQPDFLGTPDDVDRLLAACDYVSLHLHLNNDTRHLLDERRLALMPPSARVINVARGALIDERALYQALESGRLAGAGLDAFLQEPPDPTLPVYGLPTVVTTPHTAGVTRRTSRLRAQCMAENVDRLARGEELKHRIDT
jgi:phosphoglycerate dehydrogenase-like enzyme